MGSSLFRTHMHSDFNLNSKMQIESIRFKNLNSLVGHWTIDFTDPQYVANGIFAITGQTGAGKSTILDAITLALFGRTPRLGLITKSSNEVMSRQTGECSAEIRFKIDEGRFMCSWSQRKARGKIDGNLQEVKHEFSKLPDVASNDGTPEQGELFPGNLDRIRSTICDKIGMDYDQLLRSMILAQGDFDLFLTAKPELRSEILERVTGTEIYSKISTAVFERQKSEKHELEKLEIEIDGIQLLDETQENEQREKLKQKSQQVESYEKQSVKLNEQIDLLEHIESLEKEIADLLEKKRIHDELETAFKPEIERLLRNEKATPLAAGFAIIENLRKSITDASADLASKKESLEKLADDLQTANDDYAVSVKIMNEKQTELSELAPVLKETRRIDQELKQNSDLISTTIKKRERLENERDTAAKEIGNIKANFEKTILQIADIDDYLGKNAADNDLVANFSGLRERLSTQMEKKNVLDLKIAKEKTLAHKFDKFKHPEAQNTSVTRLVFAEFDSNFDYNVHVALIETEIEASDRRKDLHEEELRMILKIQELHQYRTQLADGVACPLCGSLEHPFAAGNVPKKNETEIAIENEKSYRKLLDSEKKRTENAQKTSEELTELRNDISSFKSQYEQIAMEIETEIAKYSVVNANDPENIIEMLSRRRTRWMKAQDDLAKLHKAQTEHQGLLNVQKSLHSKAIAELENVASELNTREMKKNELKKFRYDSFAEKDPDVEERRIQKELSDANEKHEKSRFIQNETKNRRMGLLGKIEALTKSLETDSADLAKNESQFKRELVENDFIDELDYRSTLIPQAERDKLNEKSRQIQAERSRLDGLIEHKTDTYKKKRELPQPSEPLAELKIEQKKINADRTAILQKLGEVKGRLELNETNKGKLAYKQKAIEHQRKEYEKFNILNSLIGSQDGRKFRNFVQGLTLDALIFAANEQLEKLSNRYQLVRKSESLEIDVIDLDQAGEIRSAKNLSGGESFLVSLSLALGLSEMMSRRINVETFFLDEGFGTLDEDTLNIALAVLSKLRASGKLIGIISHVGALKDQIPTQIRLDRLTGGRSRITGPGVF